jgi:type II secretory pathway component PulC
MNMPRSLFLINIILFVIIGMLGFKLYKIWVKPTDLIKQTAVKPPSADKKAASVKRPKKPDEASYQIIVDKNLFRPSRSPVSETAEGPTTVPSKETPQLFGTTIMSGIKFAILEDPSTKSTKLYYVNDSIAGFIVSDIQQDKVILQKAGKTVEVKLRGEKKFKAPKPLKKKTPTRRRPIRSRSVKRPDKSQKSSDD